MLTRRTTFRLYPNKQQEQKLHYWRKLHCSLYNAAVYHRKTEYQRNGRNVSYLDQQNCLPAFKQCWWEYIELGSQALQATLKRVDFAYQRFFKGLAKRPTFKASRHYSGFTYPGIAGWKAQSNGKNGYLNLSNLGKIQMRGESRTWGTPTTCTIVWRQGKWYASITINCEPIRQTGTGAIGLDVGCLTAVAMSDGTLIENPRFLANAQKQINKVSRQLRRKRSPQKRKIKASRRWKKIKKQVSKLQNKVALRRQNWVHQVATDIVSSNSLVATEELAVKNMTASSKKGKRKRQKAGLNRSILDVGFGMLRSAIKYKVIEAGGVFVDVPTKKIKPSQTCPECGLQQKKELDERIHQCPCGCTLDRDVAAAQVCLNYARGLGTSLLDGDGSALPKTPQKCGGFRQQNQAKRQKLQAQCSEAE
ncbi:MAG: transposase [Gloeocapsa sp. UFS-A4-WI-NPMV-4B04]|jgi:putative transposase|nr:transposase [Gloeocapsa sp. UFS-A4-WI-NPMV-4B04]